MSVSVIGRVEKLRIICTEKEKVIIEISKQSTFTEIESAKNAKIKFKGNKAEIVPEKTGKAIVKIKYTTPIPGRGPDDIRGPGFMGLIIEMKVESKEKRKKKFEITQRTQGGIGSEFFKEW